MNTVPDTSGDGFSRRRFLAKTSALGAASFLGLARTVAAEPPPEVTKVRLVHSPAICFAPQYLAEELLRLEGFSDVEYVEVGSATGPDTVAAGRADATMWDAPGHLPALDAGKPVVVLAGVHSGCYELFATERIRSPRDLQGKTISLNVFGGGDHVLLTSMLAYIGIDPRKDVKWIAGEKYEDAMRFFVEGKADAFMGFPPQPQEMRAKGIGHAILSTAQDRPWSQYFCCVISSNRQFVQAHPVATKRIIRAILKAADLCTQEPERAARFLVAKGYEPRYEVALEVLKDVSFRMWREAHPEDTLRFHALRLHEVGMIKTSPQKLIAQGTDWRFLNELKREMKT